MSSQAVLYASTRQSALLPAIFILLWSSGYIGGAVGLHYAEPFTMTFLRFATAAAVLLVIAIAMRAPWPDSPVRVGHVIVVGFLMQAVQFGGLYSGMNKGVSAGVSALIIGMMPILTAIGAGWLLRERVSWPQWGGLLLGLVGLVVVLGPDIRAGGGLEGYLLVGLALFGITAGTLYQKRFCGGLDLRTGGVIQMTVGATVMLVMATTTETMQVSWTGGFVLSVAWLALINSIGAISLLYLMIRRGEATRVASLFYLIPPVTALMASIVLAELPTAQTVTGLLLAACGVYLSNRK